MGTKWRWDGNWLVDERGELVLGYTKADDGLHGESFDKGLIAAAPDLYEALYYAFCVMEAEGNDTDVVEKALLKARGETA